MAPIMTRKDLSELISLNEIANHAQYFLAVCVTGSIGGGAAILNATPRTVLNHIKWLQCLTGEKLLQNVLPGQTMKLSVRGKILANELRRDFLIAVKSLNSNKMDDVVGNRFMKVIKYPYWSYKEDPPSDTAGRERTEEAPTSASYRSNRLERGEDQ